MIWNLLYSKNVFFNEKLKNIAIGHYVKWQTFTIIKQLFEEYTLK